MNTTNQSNLPDQNEKLLAALGYFSFAFLLPLAIRPDSQFCRFHGKQSLAMNMFFFLGSNLALILFGSGSAFFFYLFLIFVWIMFMFFMCFAAFAGNLSKLPFFFSVASRMQIFPDEKIEALSSPAPVPAAAPPAENTAKQGAEAASETNSPEAATENKKST